MTFDEAARAILEEARRRSYNRHDSIACLSTAIQESSLRAGVVSPNGKWVGFYQQDASYPGRYDAHENYREFFNRLDKKRASSGASPDIWKNIFWLQQRPGEKTADAAYNNGRKAYLTEIQRHTAQAGQLYDRFIGGAPAPAPPPPAPVRAAGKFWPLGAGRKVTSPFGPRSGGFHYGTDFGRDGGSAGMPVYAIQGGTVIHAGAASGYGGPDPAGWLVIDHPAADGGGCTEYGHIIREVAKGQRVEAGQRVGHINPNRATNGGTAPHLHLSFMPHGYNPGAKQDPVPWLAGAREPGGAPTPPPAPAVAAPRFTQIDMFGKGGSPRSRQPINFFIHTEEGNGSAKSLAEYCQGQNGVSYHFTLRDGIVYYVVPTNLYSWSVLAANVFSINLCFAGSRAAFTRAEWLQRERDIEIAAFIAVREAKHFGFSTEVLTPQAGRTGRDVYAGEARPGISDHNYVTRELGIGNHTDVGPNFPWDVFSRYVAKYANNAQEDELSAEAERMIRDIHRELTQRHPSRSAFREPGEGLVDTWAGMDLNTDGNVDFLATVERARLGHPPAIARLERVAASSEPGRSADDALLAQAVLAELSTPATINSELRVAPAPAQTVTVDTSELRAAYDEIARLREENAQLRAAQQYAPPPLAELVSADPAPSTGQTSGDVVGKVVDSVENWTERVLAMDVKQRAALATSLKALELPNGAQS